DLAKIADIQVAALAKRLAARQLRLSVSEAARQWLAVNGFDPVYGARPLRRLVQTAIGDALARGLIGGAIRDGQTVVVDAREDGAGLSVSVSDGPPPSAAD
ncbi:MAG: ATP-dependent chaperone ClpB, partial [Actinomycetia bacterium]|nr:ATP-dependent chaperone ClpB [Actinomycetes bacterium]